MNKSVWILGLVVLAAGCRPGPEKTETKAEAAPAHAHHAPHGGALAELGEEFAHVETVLSPEGELRLYLLDGESENPVRSKQKSLRVLLEKGDVLDIPAVANPLTGETVGDSSEFVGIFTALKGADHFHGVLERVDVRGKTFESVELQWPRGDHAEHDH